MKHINVFILSVALMLASLKGVELGLSLGVSQGNHELIQQSNVASMKRDAAMKALIQRSNRQTALKLMEIRASQAPCELQEFEIIREK